MVLRVNGYFYLLNNVRYINIHGKLTEIVNLLEKWKYKTKLLKNRTKIRLKFLPSLQNANLF